jgi:hypothetical protein
VGAGGKSRDAVGVKADEKVDFLEPVGNVADIEHRRQGL